MPIEDLYSNFFRQLLGVFQYELVGDSAGYLLGLPGDRRLVYDFHEECHYMKRINPIITAHFPLNLACTAANGAMAYLKKSSYLRLLPTKKIRLRMDILICCHLTSLIL